MSRRFSVHSAAVVLTVFCGVQFLPSPRAQEKAGAPWSFAASGDSRNCGDVVVPAIAAGVIAHHAAFYWHLGDLRKIYDFDEDMQHEPEHMAQPMTIIGYEQAAWPDFIANQIESFGSLPYFLGIGNHETIPPMTRDLYIQQFADWLDSPVLREQRLRDNPANHKLETYYHWIERGVDFINLDNATADQFDRAQLSWFEGVLSRDEEDRAIHTIVVGMHEALPYSISIGHSMNESPVGIESGVRVYTDLLKAQNETHKHIYVLASHSHFYMEDIFNTGYWKSHGGVLPGWIVGTAGAVRYALPPDSKDAKVAETNVYGYLLGTVQPEGTIQFTFEKLRESDVPASVATRFTQKFVDWCFAENSQAK